MTKSKTLWLSRDNGAECGIDLWSKRPFKNDVGYFYYRGNCEMCTLNKRLIPLKLRAGQCIEVKLTTLKNGFKLERKAK